MTYRWQQTLADYLYVLAETLPWFMAITLVATWGERDFMAQLAVRVAAELPPTARSELVMRDLIAESKSVITGPQLWVIVLMSAGAFALMRSFTRAGVSGGISALALMVVTIVTLNVALHVTLAHDLKVWDTNGIVGFLDNPGSRFPRALDVAQFVANPTFGRPHGAAATVSFLGLIALWVRFLIAGRASVSFERTARSFTVGFVATLVVVALASVSGVTRLTAYAVPYFVLAVLMLAVAHSARPQTTIEGARRTAPWAFSVAGTIAALAGVALLLGLLALVDAGSAFQFVADGIFRLIGWIMVLVITPIFWVIESVLHLLHFSGQLPKLPEIATPTPGATDETARNTQGGRSLLDVLVFALKLVALSAIMYGIFAGLRALLNRRRQEGDEDYEEVRTADAAAGGLGNLLRNLVSRRRGNAADGAWLRRHAIYRLFARAVLAARERGLNMQPGETPREFAAVGERMLEARPFTAIAAEFDRARYGRHYPDDEVLSPLERSLIEWERAHFPTEAGRERVRGARELTETQSIEANIVLKKRAGRGDPNARRLL